MRKRIKLFTGALLYVLVLLVMAFNTDALSEATYAWNFNEAAEATTAVAARGGINLAYNTGTNNTYAGSAFGATRRSMYIDVVGEGAYSAAMNLNYQNISVVYWFLETGAYGTAQSTDFRINSTAANKLRLRGYRINVGGLKYYHDNATTLGANTATLPALYNWTMMVLQHSKKNGTSAIWYNTTKMASTASSQLGTNWNSGPVDTIKVGSGNGDAGATKKIMLMAIFVNQTWLSSADIAALYNSGSGKPAPYAAPPPNVSVSTTPKLSNFTNQPPLRNTNMTINVTNYVNNYATLNIIFRVNNSVSGAILKNATNASARHFTCATYLGCGVGTTIYAAARMINKTTSPGVDDKSTYSNIINTTIRAFLTATIIDVDTGVAINGATIVFKMGSNSTIRNNVTGNKFYLWSDRGTWNATISKVGYSTTEYNLSVNKTMIHPNWTLTLPTTNSVYILIKNERTGQSITLNTTITSTYELGQFVNYTTAGKIYLRNLIAGNYTFTGSAAGYTARSYSVSISTGSFRYLRMYLLNSSDEVLFTLKDSLSLLTLENATLTLQRILNSTWTSVGSLKTDPVGQAKFIFDSTAAYRVLATKSGYQDTYMLFSNSFNLNAYTILMVSNTNTQYSSDYAGVTAYYSPKTFYNYTENNGTYVISSPQGKLIAYEFNLSYPTGLKSYSGANAYGGTYAYAFNITPGQSGQVKINLSYTISDGTYKLFKYNHEILLDQETRLTIAANIGKTYGMGVFERLLIVTLLTIFFVGVVSYYGQPVAGVVIGLLIMGYFTWIGFIDKWFIILSAIIGFLYVTWVSSR